MSNFQDKYKQKRGGANDAAAGRMMRVRQQDERRRVNRAENFSRNRDVSPIPQIEVPETQETSSVDVRFRRWKLEKELKRKMDQRNKKPIFKVGVVHHRLYSPLATDKTNDMPCHPRGAHRVKTKPSPPKRITRATQKRLAAKMAASMAAASSQPGTSGTALSVTPSQPSTSAANVCVTTSRPCISGTALSMTPSQPSTSAAPLCATLSRPCPSGTALSVTSSQPSTSAATACSTPFQSGTSTPAALASSFLSSTRVAAECATLSQLGTRSAALSTTPFQPRTSAAAACVTPLWSNTSTTTAPSSSSLSSMSTTRPSTQKKAFPSAKKVPGVSFAPPTYAFKGPEGVKRMPMFGHFATSTSSSSESAHSSEVEAGEELPWPSGSISLPSDSPLNNSNRLRRQNAIESSSVPASECFSSRDSLVEEKSMKMELDPPVDATTFQPVESQDITVVETLTCSSSPSPAMFSPYVTTSRGKDCARRERRSKMGIGCTPPDDVPTKETVMRNLNISVEEEERTAQYFRFILQRETERLNEICAKWEKVKGEPGLTEDARYLINQAIGQTTLLVRKKFERFRSLVADCETGKGEMLVQCRDLQGFWDMTYVEVKNCDSRFQKLDQLQSTGWVEEEIVLTTKRPTGIRKKVAANKFTMNAKSSARSWILAKRKVMSRTEEGAADVISVRNNSEESRPATSGDTHSTPREKSRRSLGNSPRTLSRSAKRASMKITPKKTPASLLKKVQLSETKKHARSPLTVMKISQMCKTPDIRLDETISYVNSDQTPGRGILKKSDETTTTDIAVAKSTRKVDFNDVFPSEARTAENLENSIDLARVLARIESYDSDSSDSVFEPENVSHKNVTLRRIAKHLDFENEFISETSETDSSMTTEVRKLSTLVADIPNEENHSEDESLTRRVLRNRTVSVGTPKKSTRRSTQSSSAREKIVELDSSVKENDDPQIPAQRKSLSESSRIFYVARHSEEPNKIRRSMRKSVRFNAEDCTGCADSSKPVHPMTPHVRRSRKISLLGDDSRRSIGPAFDGDLISFDSPAVPSRIRRTSQASRKSTQ